MRPRMWFGVALRAMGVWWLGYAVVEILTMIFKLDGVPISATVPWQANLMYAAANALVGLVMFLGADGIARFAYRETPPEDEVERF